MRPFLYSLFLFLIWGLAVSAQERIIKGLVKDEGGTPLIGVNIVVVGTSNGTATDGSGEFSLTLGSPDSTRLHVSYIGFQDQAVPVLPGDHFLNITLLPKSVELNEVVTVGYGIQKKVNLTGAVSAVSGEDLEKRPVMRASAALEGLAAGISVRQTSGKPFEDGGTIKVRGIGTLGNSDPLVLVDGVEGNLDEVDPNEIENISILKDAASAAIYGSRAANGVILVTTKKGKKGAPTISYNSYFGVQRFTNFPKYANGYQYMTALNRAYENEGRTPLYSESYLEEYRQNYQLDPYTYPNNDWAQLVYTGSGFVQSHSLSISGGNDFLTARAALSYKDQHGQIPGYRSERYQVIFNIDANISKNLQVGLRNVTAGFSPNLSPTQNFIDGIVRNAPIYPALLENGKYGIGSSGQNPLAMARAGGLRNDNRLGFKGTFFATLKPVKDVSIALRYTPDFSDSWTKAFVNTVPLYNAGSDVPAYITPGKNSLNEANTRTWENTLQLLLNYEKEIKRHHFHLLAGYEQVSYRYHGFDAGRIGFPLQEFQELNAGSIDEWTNSGTSEEWALQSVFGRLNYNFSEKYLFEANLRYDGSSRFARGRQFGLFPSFSAGWRISKESFLQDISWLTDLKLRASYGELGNQLIGTYPFASSTALGINYIFGDAPANGAAQTEMANTNISWEKTKSKDIGFDLSLFDGKINLTYDYYIKKTTDILLQLPVPFTTGLTKPYQNAGAVENKGWDLSVSYRDQIGALRYKIDFNLSDVKNKVLDLKGSGPYISTYSIIKEGYPIDELYGYTALGLFQNEAEVEKRAEQFGTYGPGDIIYRDQNKDGVINADDKVELGSQLPRFTYGMNFSFGYRNFDLGFLLQGVGKRDIFLYRDAVWAFYNSGKIQTWQLDYWTPENPDARYPRLVAQTNHNNFENSDYWIYNASYLRLKDMQVGYTFSQSLLSGTFIKQLRVYLTGRNILTLDHMPKGWDPEMNSGSTVTYYPISNAYVFGINVSF